MMKKCAWWVLWILVTWVVPQQAIAQEEEESAAVSLEGNTDEFQEHFFEALKQKGIENYDKAINALLECKRLEPGNVVVDHELAKAYLADRQLIRAMEYGTSALIAEPENLWYLETLVRILQAQKSGIDAIEHTIPYANAKLRENLATIYYLNHDYNAALDILKGLEKSDFSEILILKIRDSQEQPDVPAVAETDEENPLDRFTKEIDALLVANSYAELERLSAEAVESFPTHLYFYYINGLALNRNAKHREAADILESALDYFLDDAELHANIYRELVTAYTALGNSSRANMYLSKLKSGS